MIAADVNGDGDLAFLLRQSPGQLKSNLYAERGGKDEVLIHDQHKILAFGVPA